MALYISKTKLPIIFEYILFASFIEVCMFYFFNLIGLQIFQMIPYLRLISIFITTFFFFKPKYLKPNFFSISIANNSENKLVLYWLFFTIIGLFIGVLKGNSILYLFTDVIYVVFGYLLYRLFLLNSELLSEMNFELNGKQERKFVYIILILSILALILHVDLPSYFIIFSLCFSLYLFNKKKLILTFLCLLPFFFQIITSGRALLFVFIFILFFSLTQNKFSKTNIKNLLIILFVIIIIGMFFLGNFLEIIINYLPQKSSLKDRLMQIMLIFNGKANWNSPTMLSLAQRVQEAKLVFEYWTSSIYNFLFGGGMGATIQGFSFKDDGVANSALLGKSAIHNIHLLPFSLIFRYGVFGVFIFILLMKNVLNYFFKILLSQNSLFKTLIVFQFSWILYSIPAAAYLWTCPLFWITLAYISNEKKTKHS
jgi:hypothetical protein